MHSKKTDSLSEGVALSKIILSPCRSGSTLMGRNFLPWEVEPYSEGAWSTGKQTDYIYQVSLVKMVAKIFHVNRFSFFKTRTVTAYFPKLILYNSRHDISTNDSTIYRHSLQSKLH